MLPSCSASNDVIGGRERAKHIDIRKRSAHEVSQHGEMPLVRVPTASQLADICTKGIHYPQWQACVEGILGRTFKPFLRDLQNREGVDR